MPTRKICLTTALDAFIDLMVCAGAHRNAS
jgi:hypothetical protein